MRPFLKLLGARVKELRLERAIRVFELASTLGYNRSALYQLERGTYTPGIPLLVGLAQAFKVDELDFLVFPGSGARADLIESTRGAPSSALAGAKALLHKARPARVEHADAKKPARAKAKSKR